MSLSLGNCEAAMTAATLSFFNTLWEQAAAQGITVTVSAGDNGTAGCDDFSTQTPAAAGIAASGIASTPLYIWGGGAHFEDAGTHVRGGFLGAANSTDGKRGSGQGVCSQNNREEFFAAVG